MCGWVVVDREGVGGGQGGEGVVRVEKVVVEKDREINVVVMMKKEIW